MLKSHVKKVVPRLVLDGYGRIKRYREQRRNLRRTTEEVFTSIYQQNVWGGAREDFCSGSGTTAEAIVSAYVQTIFAKASEEKFRGLSFVDLGCGDFRVGKQLLPLCSSYTGVDIVKPLIQNNQESYANDILHFVHLNIVEDELPQGDVCFLRQVLQHLSNQQIGAVLPKLTQYRWVFITEHYPTENRWTKPNLDKTCGGDIRAYNNSGVFLEEPPFELPAEKLEQVLEVSGTQLGERKDRGVIRTFLYKPGY